MAGKEYKGKDKKVQKMTRDGLTEENLRDSSVKVISQKPSTRAAPFEEQEKEIELGGKSKTKDAKDKKLKKSRRQEKLTSEESLEEKDVLDEATSEKSSYQKKFRNKAQVPDEEDLTDFKDSVKKKQKREKITKEQKKSGKLNFDDETSQMAKGSAGIGKKTLSGAVSATSAYAHRKLYEAEDDNDSVKAAHASEIAMERATKSLKEAQERSLKSSKRSLRQGEESTSGSRLKFSSTAEGTAKDAAKKNQEKKSILNRFWQKKRYKEAYAAAKGGSGASAAGSAAAKSTETLTAKGIRVAKEIFKRNSMLFAGLGIVALLFMVISVSLSSCASSIQGGGTLIGVTTYPSTDTDIHAAEDAYAALEAALNAQINNMESTHPGYDTYEYQVDEITHNPYHLISYLTAKYGEFTYAQVSNEIQSIFDSQYTLTTEGKTETRTETKTVTVGQSLGSVVTSGYCNCSICCGQWSGGPTASGAMPQANHTIAVDAHNPIVPMGTKIVMNGAEYTVEDTGNLNRYGVNFDVYYGSHSAASAHGHKNWEAYIADDNGSKQVEVTNTTTQKILYVNLANEGFDAYARANLDEEQLIIYDALNKTLGNRDYLFDLNNFSNAGNGDGFKYDIPAEALSDKKFANMIKEAEKYLGYPYVWGGASPSTSFDCSGFVSWVINNCGNGWNVGRQTADGLRGCCAQVSPSEAKPGDLIFFKNTYPTSGASHVGIYVGNGMMIHCGNPIKYSSIETSYWQEHFMAFGRIQ